MFYNKCAVIVNGFYTNGAIEHQVSRLTEELLKRGVQSQIVKSDEVICRVEGENCVCALKGVDFVLYLDKDVHTARMLERCGYRLFNSASAIELCDDKMLTYIALSGKGINMPKTISSPVMYRPAEDGEFLNRVEKNIPYPVVVKESFGSMGNGVHLAKNRAELENIRERLKLQPHLYQQLVGKGGEDKRVIVVGGKVVACMLRRNEEDFRSNIEHGGKGYVTEISKEEEDMAVLAAETLGLDYAGVDILKDENGNPCFCEANSNAFMRGVETVSGANVAGAYAEHIFKKIYSK